MKNGIIIRDKCPICNSNSSKSIFNRSFNEELLKNYINNGYQGNADIMFLEDVIFEIVKCNECQLSYQKFVLDDAKLNELYNKWIDPRLAQEWNENGKKLSRRAYTFILNFAKKKLKQEAGKIKVLDFGAGFGDSLLLAKELGFDSYAFEYSTERIQFLEEKGIKVIDQKNDMLFDLIIVNQVLEHLTYPNEILKFIISKLNKNGLIYIAVPNCRSIEKKLKKTNKISEIEEFHKVLLDASVAAFQHINFFNNYNLKLFLKNFGLTRIRPFNQSLVKPLNIRYFILPFYNYYFRTSFFLKKVEK